MNYKHTQIGYLIIASLVLVGLLYAVTLIQEGFDGIILGIMATVMFVLFSFSWLQVTVDEKLLKIKFGWGIFRKQFKVEEIAAVETVKNKWYYGWGIRWCVPTKVWIYNVSGFYAVEITTKDGKKYRIGTDEPQALEKVIKQGIK